MGSAKARSGFIIHFPLQLGQAPIELKLNMPAACFVPLAMIRRISSIIPMYVARVERLEIPILSCPIQIVSGYLSKNSPNIKLLLPDPDTPHIDTNACWGILILIFFKL